MSEHPAFPHLFRPFALKNVTLKNRIGISGHFAGWWVDEGGLPGLGLFLALVVVSLGTAFRRLRDGFDANARLAFGLALTAIFVHSVFYNALFEDPTFWGLLGLIAVAARAVEELA